MPCSPPGARVDCTCAASGPGEQLCTAAGRFGACTCIAGADAAGTDAARPDAGAFDAGSLDGGGLDAGAFDAGAGDAGPRDAGPPDAGPRDAGRDAGPPDAGSDAARPDAGTDAGPPAGIGCLDGTVEVTWSPTVVACAGPTQIWQTYRDNPAAYCAPGWTMARSHIVNDYLTRPAYAADVLYAFDGEGCEGWVYATRYDSYSQSRGGCGWLDSHHWSVGRPPGGSVNGIVCERP